MIGIAFAIEPQLDVTEFVDVLHRSTLAERRPVHDLERIAAMLRHADIIATARSQSGQLVGVARAISDFSYCTYLSDLAVDVACQRCGIGRRLIDVVRQTSGPQAKLILLAAPAAVDYYPAIGMSQHHSCWFFADDVPVGPES